MAKNNPLVSIVIPTYKRPTNLKRAIDSVINQTYKKWELIVVDDNEPETVYRKETEGFMKRYAKNAKIRYIKHNKNKGAPAARNLGIKKAKGEYVGFLDDDDEWVSSKLEKQLEVFENSNIENLAFVYSRWWNIQGNNIRKSDIDYRDDFTNKLIMYQNGISNSVMLFRKESLLKVGGFLDLPCAQDLDLVLRLFAKGYKADFYDNYLVKIHIHQGERITTSLKKIEGTKRMFETEKKYYFKLSLYEKLVAYSNYHYKLMGLHLGRGLHMQAVKEYLLAFIFFPFNPRIYKGLVNTMSNFFHK
ncbi:MAG: glycosyltransferase family 2 protein [Nanobdellota archaeon]